MKIKKILREEELRTLRLVVAHSQTLEVRKQACLPSYI